jgi:hypothetical protein
MSNQHDWDSMNAEQRLNKFKKSCSESQQIWLLTDEHGSVMMTTDDEDCIPVWPTQAAAEQWATDEWAGFEAKSISTSDWKKKWTVGLEQDELAVVVFPVPNDDGVVMFPDEFEWEVLDGKK